MTGKVHTLAVLLLSIMALAGMVLGRWELVLYPSLLLVGVLLAAGRSHRGRWSAVVPVVTAVLLVGLFALLHLNGLDSSRAASPVLGWDPLTAAYLFIIGPAFLLVGVFYALTDGAQVEKESDR